MHAECDISCLTLVSDFKMFRFQLKVSGVKATKSPCLTSHVVRHE